MPFVCHHRACSGCLKTSESDAQGQAMRKLTASSLSLPDMFWRKKVCGQQKKNPQKNKNNRNSFRNISISHHLNKHLIDVLSDFFNFSLKFEVEVLPHLKSSELNDWMEKQKVQKRYLCSPLYSCHHTSHPVVVRVQIQSILKGGGDLKVLKPQDNCCYKL